MKKTGSLYIVATPIGNWEDITLRAINTLKSVDLIVCEELREGSTLLKKLAVPPKELINLNEHNEQEQVPNLIQKLAGGMNIALISDCGTPVFADPGHFLIEQAAIFGFEIIPIPGASSLMATLSILDFQIKEFHYAGFLPREKVERQKKLIALRSISIPIILLDTPYRLTKLLEEVGKVFGKNRRITLATDISMSSEQYYRGTVSEILIQLNQKKAEFVLVIHPKSTNLNP
ncbi:MAG: 16S rRNA (cytidine(1402)-2'-O)-methyltransferase [Anaerolineaceae bacterium]|jgi:16S rRNA (cytidine1402-2'-O)-methyltransferase|nr:MAG: 16S rRNA (cytidine(1402)-2'-O)-methyltransferase [Chloroflexi bacterium HGW-Chloroflexi-8]